MFNTKRKDQQKNFLDSLDTKEIEGVEYILLSDEKGIKRIALSSFDTDFLERQMKIHQQKEVYNALKKHQMWSILKNLIEDV